MSDGASRKYRPLSGYVDSFLDVLAGDHCTTPAFTILSMTVKDTLDDAAPMMASTFSARRRSTVWLAVSVDVSPESPCEYSTSLPPNPPFSFTSEMARLTPANSGGPRNARLPVSGRIEPNLRVPSPARVPSTGT